MYNPVVSFDLSCLSGILTALINELHAELSSQMFYIIVWLSSLIINCVLFLRRGHAYYCTPLSSTVLGHTPQKHIITHVE